MELGPGPAVPLMRPEPLVPVVPVVPPSPARRTAPNDMNGTLMLFLRHECGIDVAAGGQDG
jgi:hypothetical protein